MIEMTMSDTVQPTLFKFGERALVIDCASMAENQNKLEIQRRLWSLAEMCSGSGDFDDIVPGNNNLTLFLKFSQRIPFWNQRLLSAWSETQVDTQNVRLIKIPVIYGGEFGPDLAHVANYNKLGTEEVIDIHSSTHYQVLFLGFQPGFPYLHGLDKRLFTPRLATPRVSIPAGAVGIGGAQTGIYPAQSPGGWQLIGHTPISLFDQQSTPPSLLSPGDSVQFISVSSIEEANIVAGDAK